MEYIKLIALKIDDFCSSIFYEDNYALKDIGEARIDKADLESRGYICILVKTKSNIQITNIHNTR